MAELLHVFWNTKVLIYPLLILILVSEGLTYFRARFRQSYVPLYFAAMPFSEINKIIARYYHRDNDFDKEPTPELNEELRRKLYIATTVTFLLVATLFPIILALVGAFVGDRATFYGFLAITFLIRLKGVLSAYDNFLYENYISFKYVKVAYWCVYIFFYSNYFWVASRTFEHSLPFVESGDALGLLNSAWDNAALLIWPLVLSIVAPSLVTLFLNKQSQEKSLEEIQEMKDDEANQTVLIEMEELGNEESEVIAGFDR
jgi:hypothetical protein